MALNVLPDGACAGHTCDLCPLCSSGSCCRRDNPNRVWPALGDWDGPIHGELGIIASDGPTVQCHCCGNWFASLSKHVISQHGIWAEEYRRIFGLRADQGLISTDSSGKITRNNLERNSVENLRKNPPNQTREQLSAAAKSRRISLQERLNPAWQKAKKTGNAAAVKRKRELQAQGWRQPSPKRRSQPIGSAEP